MTRHQSKKYLIFICIPIFIFKKHNFFLLRISVDDVRSKLSSNSKNKKCVPKSVEQSNEEDSDDYELGKDLREEKKRKA